MGHEKRHSREHVDGTDDIQEATPTENGLATPTQITKLDGIAEGADVTGKKAGIVANTAWGAGNPKMTAITFATAYADNNYAVVVTGEDSRGWSIESKSVNGFTINSNSNVTPTGNTFWITIKGGE